MLNEAHIEHAFGRNFQNQTNEHAQMDEYLYAKRRVEMERILKVCDTPFFFEARKKDYAEAPDSSSVIDVFRVLELLERPPKPLRSTREPKLKADKEVVRVARIMTHGMRSQANRAIHKPGAFYAPTQVGFSEMDLRANIEPSDETADNLDEITGLHICFAELEDGTAVARDDWVAFSFGPKLLIGVYKKSIGHESLIDSTAILGDNLFGWPCHCANNTDYHPMVSCQNSACTDISFIETKDIICRFNCPVLTRRGFKIPNAVQKIIGDKNGP